MKLRNITILSTLCVLTLIAAPHAAHAQASVTGSYLSGQFLRSRGDVDSAITELRRVHQNTPDDMNVAVQLQGMLILQGEFDEAIDLAEEIENSDVDDPLADLLLALGEIKDNDLEEATIILDNANQGDNPQLWVPLLAGWVDVSRHQLQKPLTIDGLGMDVGRAAPLINYHLALINSQAGFKDAAAKNFKAAIENPQNPPARIMAMLLKFYDKNDAPEILAPLVNSYMQTHPTAVAAPIINTPNDGVAEVLYTMGGIMYGAGVVNDAAIYLQLASFIKPDMDEAVVALADAFSELRQYERSNATYAKIPSASPLYAKAQLHIAVNFERMGQLPEALKHLDTLAKTSQDTDILVTKGDLLRFHSRFSEAVATYTEALKRLPAKGEDNWSVLFARAACLDRMGKWSDAEKDLQAALVLKPDQPDVLNYLGFARLERGEMLDEARAMISKAIAARPDDAQIIDSMGWALYSQGQYKDAAEYLEKAVELLPGDPTVNDHLGDTYWRLGRKTEARFQWQRSLTFNPEEKLANVIQKKLKEGLPATAAMASGTTESKSVVTATP